MQESLVCASCAKTWKRQKVRGRKPTLCPACVSTLSPASVEPVKKTTKQSSQRSIQVHPIAIEDSVEIKEKPKISISQVHQSLYPRSKDSDELRESTKNGSSWKCPSCGHIIVLYVAVSDIPTHKCTPDTVSVKLCERIK